MEPVQSHSEDAGQHEKDKEEKSVSSARKLVLATTWTMLLTSLIGFSVVFALIILGEAGLLSGYLNSIPRIMERRDAYLAESDAFYSHDFNVRGEIAALIYDNSDSTIPIERITTAKEAVRAAGVALVDQNGDVVADTETPDVAAPPDAASSSEVAATESTDGRDSEKAETEGTLDAVDIDQVISSEESLVIINEKTEGGETIRIDTLPTQVDSEESVGEGDEPKASIEEGDGADLDESEEKKSNASKTAKKEDEEAKEAAVEWKSASEEQEGAEEGDASEDSGTYVYYRAEARDGSTLVVKFDPTASLKLNQEEGQWKKLLDRLVAGIDAYAFVREDATGSWTAYPFSSITDEEVDAISQGLATIDERITFTIPLSTSSGYADLKFGIIPILGKVYLVGTRSLADRGLTFVMAISFSKFLPGGLRSCLAVAAMFLVSVFLFVHYIRVVRTGMSDEYDAEELLSRLKVMCHSGLYVMTVVLAVFTLMSIMLSKSATTAMMTRTQRESLTYELTYQESIIKKVLDENMEETVTQAKACARLLSAQPQLRTKAGLMRLTDIVGARYLMLFDKGGKELFSSNSYVGFQVEKDDSLSVETIADAPGLQAMLLGESCIVSDPIEDGEGNDYRVIAALIVDEEGLPDGFLVMAADDVKATDSRTDDLSSLLNREGQVAMVVDGENGVILKHSDVAKVGDSVSSYLSEDVLGRSYEGYTWYEGEYVYMSSDVQNNISTIVLSTRTMGFEDILGMALLITINSILICLLYYPHAIRYCCMSRRPLKPFRFRSPLFVFLYGYNFFLCILSVIAFVSSSRGNWPAYRAVFEGAWTRGVNQFAVWSAVFFTAQTTTLVLILKHVLKRMTEKSTMGSKTIIRLCDSLVTYVAAIVIVLVDLGWFGVDTTALIASAGIVSIAVGMGAKDLIADMLAGAFIIFESSVRVGDIVEIEGWRGTITDIGIRTCEITNRNNNVKVVNNSRISNLINYSRKNTRCTMEIEISRVVPIDELPGVVDGYIKDLTSEVPEVSNSLHFVEVTNITDDSYKIAISWSCDESEREGLTFRLNNAMRLIQERVRKSRQEGSSGHWERRADKS